MEKKHKYQWLIEREGINSNCPEAAVEANMESYRWVYSNIENEFNFLPTVLFNEKRRNAPRRQNDANKHCSMCGLSMFDSIVNAKKRHDALLPKWKEDLGYTHIAKGQIKKELGVITSISKDGHFDFFEYEGVNLTTEFVVFAELN